MNFLYNKAIASEAPKKQLATSGNSYSKRRRTYDEKEGFSKFIGW